VNQLVIIITFNQNFNHDHGDFNHFSNDFNHFRMILIIFHLDSSFFLPSFFFYSFLFPFLVEILLGASFSDLLSFLLLL